MSGATPMTTTVDLFTQHLQFDASGTIRTDERRLADGDDIDWRLPLCRVETAADVHADHWEMHPGLDEAVCCLRGAISESRGIRLDRAVVLPQRQLVAGRPNRCLTSWPSGRNIDIPYTCRP
jgi:hypothetical protein